MTGERTDLYAVLGLTSQASQEQIRHAFRTLVRQNHPDTRPFGEPADLGRSDATLQCAFAAYSVLGDPARRARYDHRTHPIEPAAPMQVRPVLHFGPATGHQPPIVAGPVRWQRSR